MAKVCSLKRGVPGASQAAVLGGAGGLQPGLEGLDARGDRRPKGGRLMVLAGKLRRLPLHQLQLLRNVAEVAGHLGT